jgi:hypothetical protein
VELPFQKRAGQSVNEIVGMVKTYAKQETVDPLRNAGRFLAWGIAGAVCLGLGTILLLTAILRAMQYWMHGAMSWAPYLITLAVGAVVVGLAAWRIGVKHLGDSDSR